MSSNDICRWPVNQSFMRNLLHAIGYADIAQSVAYEIKSNQIWTGMCALKAL